MFGRFGTAEMKLRVIGFAPVSDKVVLRCSLESVEKLRAALAIISYANQQPAAAMVIRSSGTIRGLTKSPNAPTEDMTHQPVG
jgi:RNase P/RNase MRP subunit POP5